MLVTFNFINHFTAAYVGINSRVSGIAGEGYTDYYYFPVTTPPRRANPTTWQCPEYAGREPRPTSTAHLTIMTGLTGNLKKD